jgi:hypothetical protein
MARVALAIVLVFVLIEVALGQAEAGVVEIVSAGTPVFASPSRGAARLGTLAAGTRLRSHARIVDPSCPEGYVAIEQGFVCGRHAKPTSREPFAEAHPIMKDDALLPFRYAFVRIDGALAHRRPEDYFDGVGAFALGKGYGVVVRDEVEQLGQRFIRLRDGHLLSTTAVGRVRGSSFEGVTLAENEPLDVAFARRDGVLIRDERGRAGVRLGRRDVVRVASIERGQAKLVDGGLVAVKDLHLPRLQAPPEGVFAGEVFIDVDLTEQALTVYRGARPVFVTLVSTGRRGRKSETREGVFRIWAKLAATDMRDVERTDLPRNYFIESVPWVQFFDEAIGLHAAFWHDDFGRPRSHGCVNLSPKDARRVFELTRPELPPGWEAVLVDPDARPTLVRVHR